MTRTRRPSVNSARVGSILHLPDSESNPARIERGVRGLQGHATPETKAKDVFKLERARQRTVIRHMQATHDEMALTTKVLLELLSDPALVALLRAEGFTLMPKLLHRRLAERR